MDTEIREVGPDDKISIPGFYRIPLKRQKVRRYPMKDEGPLKDHARPAKNVVRAALAEAMNRIAFEMMVSLPEAAVMLADTAYGAAAEIDRDAAREACRVTFARVEADRLSGDHALRLADLQRLALLRLRGSAMLADRKDQKR